MSDNSYHTPSENAQGGGAGQALKAFQLDRLTIAEKSTLAWGKSIGQYIDSTVNGGYQGYYYFRNAQYRKNRQYANGRVPMQKFMDLLDFNGKVNYANINWQCIHIVNRIVSGLVGRWMGRNEKIVVTAIDSLSLKDKEEEYKNLEFIVSNKAALSNLEQASGVSIIPKDKQIPDNKEELDMWQAQFQRTPEEILAEMAINDILQANTLFDAGKEKLLHDVTETGFLGTYTWMDENGVVHIDILKPENCLYSYSEFPDFRDTSWRGHISQMKISELRRTYGVEFGGILTEEQLWDIAQTCKEYQLRDKLTWDLGWNNAWMRPYDEWNTDVTFYELKTVDSDNYTITETRQNKSTIIQKGVPNKLKDNQTRVEDTHWNIYRGAYLRVTQQCLEWGLKKNMIRPQDPKEIGNAEFSYSFYMPQNYDMRNLGIPEKIQEPADQMILARLKMQQLVAKMKPIGAAINIDAMQEIDFGLGNMNKDIDYRKLYDQTGDIYYRGRDAEGQPIGVPITELQNSGFIQQMQGLIQLYNYHYQVLKDELGEDPNLMTAAAQPRVTEGNVQTAEKSAENATDYYYDGYLYVMEETAKKVGCLLNKSVMYGAEAYRHLIGEDDMKNRVFDTKSQMLPTEPQLVRLEAFLNNAIQSNPELIMFIDPFKIMRIAKEDVKLASEFIRQGQKKMWASQQQQSQQNVQMNAQAQQQSLQMKAQADAAHLQLEKQLDAQNDDAQSKNRKEEIILQGVFNVMTKGIDVQPEWKPVIDELIHNVAIPLLIQNTQSTAALGQAIQGAQQGIQPPQQQTPQPDQSQQPNQPPQPQQQAA